MFAPRRTKKIGSMNRFLIFSFLFFFSCFAHASITVQASVDRTAMDPGDTFELRVDVNSEGDESPTVEKAPDVAGFELVNQGMSTSARAGVVTGANGTPEFKRTTQTTYSYFYQALQVGKFKVDPILVKVGDKTFHTAAIALA